MQFDPISAQITWAVVVSFLLQKVKSLDAIPFVNFEEKNANRIVAILAAAAVGAGINFTFNKNGSLLNGPGGVLSISGITLPHLYHFLSSSVQQFVYQHGAYKTIIAPPLPGKIQEEVRKINGEGPPVIIPAAIVQPIVQHPPDQGAKA